MHISGGGGAEIADSTVEHAVLHPYGIGIDTHSRFIQVCVLANRDAKITRTEKEFPTDWPSLVRAKEWAISKLKGFDLSTGLRYCIESTSTYHLPIIRAWRGTPSIINPQIAGSTKRKTDVLDAQLLAHHSITGLWKPSFVPSDQLQQLRVLWNQRADHARTASRASNRINNIILRFGHTLGATGSIRGTTNQSLISDLVSGQVPNCAFVCPDGLPDQVRGVIAALQSQLVTAIKAARDAERAARDYAISVEWPTATGPMAGSMLFDLLKTVPGVGDVTALAWLAEVGDPRRFPSAKQVAAFSGCDPSLKTSAGKTTSFVRRSGNVKLHYALVNAASGLMRSPKEPLGQLGKSIAGRHKRGGWRKACGALARRIACGLWYVHKSGQPFSYEKYTFANEPDPEAIPLRELLGRQAATLVTDRGIKDSRQLFAAYHRGELAGIHGFGDTSLRKIKDYLAAHPRRKQPQPTKQLQDSQGGNKRVYRLDSSKTYTPKEQNQTNKKKGPKWQAQTDERRQLQQQLRTLKTKISASGSKGSSSVASAGK